MIVVSIGTRWWVRSYLHAAAFFLWTVAWAMKDNDERIDAFIAKQARFVAKHGTYVQFTHR